MLLNRALFASFSITVGSWRTNLVTDTNIIRQTSSLIMRSTRRLSSSKPQARRSMRKTKALTDDALNAGLLLLDIGPLVKGKVVKRPSASIKSPYVSDVILLSDDGEEMESVLAHSPALVVGGLCVPGSIVYLSQRQPGGKTTHAIELILAPGPTQNSIHDEGEPVLIGSHPGLGEKIAEQVLKMGLLKDIIGLDCAELMENEKSSSPTKKLKNDSKELDGLLRKQHLEDTNVRLYRQRTYGDSRVDFEIEYSSKENGTKRYLIEVKNVVCSDYSRRNAPTKNDKNHCVVLSIDEDDTESRLQNTSSSYQRSALFPWGRVGQTFEGRKVVSERAIKHLRNLTDLTKSSDTTQALILFVINRSDCVKMRPCHEACPMFAEELASAASNGCSVASFRVRWTTEGKAFFDGIIPVSLHTHIQNKITIDD